MKVHEIMTAHARCVSPDTSLIEAAGFMRELDVGALPVCDGDELTGMVTDRDIVVRGIADGLDLATARVSDVMSGGVEAIMADEEVENAVRIMEQRQIRRLPVLGRSKELVGIISLGDVATSSNPAFGGMVLRDVSTPNHPSARQRRLAQDSEPMRMPMPESDASTAGGGRNRRRAATRSPRRQTTHRKRTSSRTKSHASASRRSSGAKRKKTRR